MQLKKYDFSLMRYFTGKKSEILLVVLFSYLTLTPLIYPMENNNYGIHSIN